MPLRITLRQLRALRAIAEEGSYSAAARRLHLTQPTLSVQVRQLADYVGEPVFEQVGRRVVLTDAGHEVLLAAIEVEKAMQQLAQRLAERRGVTRGRLRVVATSTAEYFMPRLLGEFGRRYPQVEISLEVLNRAAVVGRLADNAADLYVMARPPADDAILAEPFCRNPLVLVAAPDHPWTRRRSVPFDEVVAAELILREQGSGTRAWLEHYFARAGGAPRARLTLGSNEAIKQAVRGGLGLAVLSLHGVLDELEAGQLAPVRAGQFPLAADWYLVSRRSHPLPPAARAFRAFLDEAMPALLAQIDAQLARFSPRAGAARDAG